MTVNQQGFQIEPEAVAALPVQQEGDGALRKLQRPGGEAELLLQRESDDILTAGEEQATEIASSYTGAEVVSRLLKRFDTASNRHRKRVRRAIQAGVIGAVIVTMVNAVAIFLAAQQEVEFPFAITGGMLVLFGVLLVVCACKLIGSSTQLGRNRAELVAKARRHEDVCIVGPLVDMLSQPRKRRWACEMLTRLLPRLKAGEASLLNAEQRQYLCGVLRNGAHEDHDLCIAILKTFAQVGDRSMLTQVERLADAPAKTRRQRELKEEAQRCLPSLQKRAQHEQASLTLLRASNVTTSTSDSLLRPIAANATTASDHLLRPAESG